VAAKKKKKKKEKKKKKRRRRRRRKRRRRWGSGGRSGDRRRAAAPRVIEEIIGETKHSTDVQKLQENAADGSRRDRPVAELRLVAEHLIPDFDVRNGAGKKKLNLKQEKKVKPAAAKVKMNLHRLDQPLWYCFFRWGGKEKWRGGHVRHKIVQLCKQKFGEPPTTRPSAKRAIRSGCLAASFASWTWRSDSRWSLLCCGNKVIFGLSAPCPACAR
jgi:hypothetical protein